MGMILQDSRIGSRAKVSVAIKVDSVLCVMQLKKQVWELSERITFSILNQVPMWNWLDL